MAITGASQLAQYLAKSPFGFKPMDEANPEAKRVADKLNQALAERSLNPISVPKQQRITGYSLPDDEAGILLSSARSLVQSGTGYKLEPLSEASLNLPAGFNFKTIGGIGSNSSKWNTKGEMDNSRIELGNLIAGRPYGWRAPVGQVKPLPDLQVTDGKVPTLSIDAGDSDFTITEKKRLYNEEKEKIKNDLLAKVEEYSQKASFGRDSREITQAQNAVESAKKVLEQLGYGSEAATAMARGSGQITNEPTTAGATVSGEQGSAAAELKALTQTSLAFTRTPEQLAALEASDPAMAKKIADDRKRAAELQQIISGQAQLKRGSTTYGPGGNFSGQTATGAAAGAGVTSPMAGAAAGATVATPGAPLSSAAGPEGSSSGGGAQNATESGQVGSLMQYLKTENPDIANFLTMAMGNLKSKEGSLAAQFEDDTKFADASYDQYENFAKGIMDRQGALFGLAYENLEVTKNQNQMLAEMTRARELDAIDIEKKISDITNQKIIRDTEKANAKKVQTEINRTAIKGGFGSGADWDAIADMEFEGEVALGDMRRLAVQENRKYLNDVMKSEEAFSNTMVKSNSDFQTGFLSLLENYNTNTTNVGEKVLGAFMKKNEVYLQAKKDMRDGYAKISDARVAAAKDALAEVRTQKKDIETKARQDKQDAWNGFQDVLTKIAPQDRGDMVNFFEKQMIDSGMGIVPGTLGRMRTKEELKQLGEDLGITGGVFGATWLQGKITDLQKRFPNDTDGELLIRATNESLTEFSGDSKAAKSKRQQILATAEEVSSQFGVVDNFGNSISFTPETVKQAYEDATANSGVRSMVMRGIESGKTVSSSIDSTLDILTGKNLGEVTPTVALQNGAKFYGNRTAAIQYLIDSMKPVGKVNETGFFDHLWSYMPGGKTPDDTYNFSPNAQ